MNEVAAVIPDKWQQVGIVLNVSDGDLASFIKLDSHTFYFSFHYMEEQTDISIHMADSSEVYNLQQLVKTAIDHAFECHASLTSLHVNEKLTRLPTSLRQGISSQWPSLVLGRYCDNIVLLQYQ